jgi:NAD(P)-dependent dehydrogenase (short-subunit alcohol dehydrogenase family)
VKAALVTGSSSGIGRAVAAALLEDGYAVTAVSRDPARGELDGADLHPADLTDPEAPAAAVAAHLERRGRLDVLVNAAGIGVGGPVAALETRHFDLQYQLNVRAPFVLTREALPALLEARGLVVNVASYAGLHGVPGLAGYVTSKHALVGLTRALRRELEGTGVRATVLCPGFVDTPMSEWIQDQIPPGRMIQTADLVATVRWLLSLSAACLVPQVEIERT